MTRSSSSIIEHARSLAHLAPQGSDSLAARDGGLGNEDGIDDLDDAIACPQVALNDGGVGGASKDRDGIACRDTYGEPKGVHSALNRDGAHAEAAALEGGNFEAVDEISERKDVSRDVVSQHLLQEVGVAQNFLGSDVELCSQKKRKVSAMVVSRWERRRQSGWWVAYR